MEFRIGDRITWASPYGSAQIGTICEIRGRELWCNDWRREGQDEDERGYIEVEQAILVECRGKRPRNLSGFGRFMREKHPTPTIPSANTK